MVTLIIKTIQKNLITLLIYTIISAAFMWMYVAMWPSFSKESDRFLELVDAYPEGLMNALNINFRDMFGSLEGFIAGEHFSIVWPIILIILVLAYASAAIAGEVEKGTIELLLAQPISRLKIFFAKYFSGLAIIAAFILLSNFSVVPFSFLHNVDFRLQNYLAISILGFLFAFAIYGICIMLSSLFSSKGRPMALTGGLLIIMYALNVFAGFRESIENIKYASFFHYYDFAAAAIYNQIDTLNIAVFLVVGIITTVIGAYIFLKRDIATT
jgi:ABC-2 type transport system permease protein